MIAPSALKISDEKVGRFFKFDPTQDQTGKLGLLDISILSPLPLAIDALKLWAMSQVYLSGYLHPLLP